VRKLAAPETFKVVIECGRFDVTVEEARPGYVVMRRWKSGQPKGQWQRRALGEMLLRDSRGAVLESARGVARDAAMKWYLELTGEIAAAAPVDIAPMRVGDVFAALTDPNTGKYPHESPFRKEVKRALGVAERVWGNIPLVAVMPDHFTLLTRQRMRELRDQGHRGVRGTEIMIGRLLTAFTWLRKTGKIPPTAAVIDPSWRVGLVDYWKGLAKSTRDPKPHQPRYTVEESRRLLHAAANVDPRTYLLLALGAEYRLGQVMRAMRSDLALSEEPHGEFTIHGSKDKQGEIVSLTRGQRDAVHRALATGVLSALEAEFVAGTRKDYPLFPGGKLSGKVDGAPIVSGIDPDACRPMSRGTVAHHWPAIEFLAGIEHVEGRGWYGIRRVGVDAALDEDISSQGLQNWGGWGSPDVPNRIYRDKENRAGRAEAAVARARFRGEAE
jgi:hypothetical protein